VINSDEAGIGLDHQAAAHKALGHTVAIAVELHPEVFVHEQFDAISVIVRNDREWFQRGRLKAVYGPLPGFTMLPLVGDFLEPLAGLAIHVVQIGELTQRPETLACVADRALHFAFFPASRQITGPRVEAIFAREAEKARKKTHQAAIVLGHGGSEIIIGDLASDTAQGSEGVHVTADESFKALAVSELQIEHAAVGFDEGESVELAFVAGVVEHAEVPPIDFETLARSGLHAHKGATRFGLWAGSLEVVTQDRGATGIAERS